MHRVQCLFQRADQAGRIEGFRSDCNRSGRALLPEAGEPCDQVAELGDPLGGFGNYYRGCLQGLQLTGFDEDGDWMVPGLWYRVTREVLKRGPGIKLPLHPRGVLATTAGAMPGVLIGKTPRDLTIDDALMDEIRAVASGRTGRDHLLPVQILGFLLLIAMLGVIVLSKKFEGMEDIK